MDKDTAQDFGTGLITILFFGLISTTTGIAIYLAIKNISLMQFLQSSHYILITLMTIVFSMIVIYSVGRLINKFLESRGIQIY